MMVNVGLLILNGESWSQCSYYRWLRLISDLPDIAGRLREPCVYDPYTNGVLGPL